MNMEIFGVVIGLVGILAAVLVMIWATGGFEYKGGRKKSKGGYLGEGRLRQQILNINAPDLPYEIKPSEKTDLEIEWKIADARWLGMFAKERVRTTYRAFMVLDEKRHTVRYWEAIGEVSWTAGAPKVHYQSEFFRGRIIFQKSYGVQYGVKEDKTFGKVFEYKFDINAIREPIRQAALNGGWEFVPVLVKSHAMKR